MEGERERGREPEGGGGFVGHQQMGSHCDCASLEGREGLWLTRARYRWLVGWGQVVVFSKLESRYHPSSLDRPSSSHTRTAADSELGFASAEQCYLQSPIMALCAAPCHARY
eukprot:2126351-Rhodomonas_salina.2